MRNEGKLLILHHLSLISKIEEIMASQIIQALDNGPVAIKA
jgi:hypothetical protein